uniref:Beta-galactosidase n=1 Tax=Amphora coffeiformis TaxID=265554 RepID=A0A7S3LFU9_9STRA
MSWACYGCFPCATCMLTFTQTLACFSFPKGHNFGLNHAFLTDRSYDFSSYMSATGLKPNLNGPLKCYNAASNRQMGFYDDRTEMINLNIHIQLVTLAAFSEAQKPYDRDPVILEVGPYSLQYNFASEFNSGTEILINQVTVAHSAPGKTIVEKEGLVPKGRIFAVENLGDIGKTLRIEACEEVRGNKKAPNSMTIAISLGVSGSPCDVFRHTSTPTLSPTGPPTASSCPDTSQVIVDYIGGGRKQKHKSLQCEWIAKRPRRRHRFCNNKLQGWEKRHGRLERIRDICRQECGTCDGQ